MNELTKKSAFGIAGMAGIAAVALAMGVAGPAMASTSNTGIAAASTVSDTSPHQTSSNQWKSTDFRTAQEAQASAALEARVDAILNSQSRHNSATSQVSLSSTVELGSSNSSTRDTNSAGTQLGATAATSSTSSSAPASAAPTSQSSPTAPVDTQTQGARLGLRNTLRRQFAIGMPLNARQPVPFGFAVTDEDECGRHAARPVTSQR